MAPPNQRIDGVIPFEACYLVNRRFFRVNAIYHRFPFQMSDSAAFLGEFAYLTEAHELLHRAVLVKAAQGRGKTHAMAATIRRLRDMGRVRKVLFVVSRQSHAAQLVHEFRAHDIVLHDYRDTPHGYYTDDVDMSVVQLDSLWRHMNPHEPIDDAEAEGLMQFFVCEPRSGVPGRPLPAIDLVVFDEFESTLMHLFADTMKRQYVVFKTMVELLKKAKYVVAMDADAGDSSLDFLMSTRAVSVQIVWNVVPMPRRTYYFYGIMQPWLARLVHDVREGKCLYIASDSKAKLNTVFLAIGVLCGGVIPDAMMYTSDTDDAHKRDLVDCETVWCQVRLVGASPVIVYGVSFAPAHFHRVYMAFTRKSVTAREACQMAGRVRNLIDMEGHIFVGSNDVHRQYEDGKAAYHANYEPVAVNPVTHMEAVRRAVAKAAVSDYAPHVVDAVGNAGVELDGSLARLWRKSLFFRQYFRFVDERLNRELRFKKLLKEYLVLAGHECKGSRLLDDRPCSVPLAEVRAFCTENRDATDGVALNALGVDRPDADRAKALHWLKRAGRATEAHKTELKLLKLYRGLGLASHQGLTNDILRESCYLDCDYRTQHFDNFARMLAGLTTAARQALRSQMATFLTQTANATVAPYVLLTGLLVHMGVRHPLLWRQAEFRGRRQRDLYEDGPFIRDRNSHTYVLIAHKGSDRVHPELADFMRGLFGDPAFVSVGIGLVFPDWSSLNTRWEKHGRGDWTYADVADVLRRVCKLLFRCTIFLRPAGPEKAYSLLMPHWARRDLLVEVLLARQVNTGGGPLGIDMWAVAKAVGLSDTVLHDFTGMRAAADVAAVPVQPDFCFFGERHPDPVDLEALFADDGQELPLRAQGIGGLLAAQDPDIWEEPRRVRPRFVDTEASEL